MKCEKPRLWDPNKTTFTHREPYDTTSIKDDLTSRNSEHEDKTSTITPDMTTHVISGHCCR